jgi:hypothetical protein
MISIFKPGIHLSRNLVVVTAIVIIAFSCSKSNDTLTSSGNNNTAQYCGTINWSITDGRSGVITGTTTNGIYTPTDAKFTDNGITGDIPLHYDSNGHLISDQPGVTYTYTQDYLSQINIDLQNTNGNGNYNFDSNGHLTSGVINFTSQGFAGTMTGKYTYDSDDDPVSFTATGTVNTPAGPVTLNIQATGDYLTDKGSILPYVPIVAPVTSNFSFIPLLSKHLLNKLAITITGTGIAAQNTTALYTYTYDANGYVSTMKRSDSPNDTYTFTYSDCK